MEYRFKTNIKCGACVSNVTDLLNKNDQIRNWDVDTNDADKILIIDSDNLDIEDLSKELKKLGYTIELL